MAKQIADRVLDFGLVEMKSLADKMFLVSADPADYTSAVSTLAVGNKNWGAGNALTGPVPGTTPTGRKVTTVPVSDGVITATATATGWAVVDSGNSRLLANGGLASSQPVTLGNTFTLVAFDIKVANQ